MQPIYRTADLRRIEQAFIAAEPTISLMERAGLAAAEKARAMLGDGFRVLVVCGPGNNGGDGLVVARHLQAWGYRVAVTLLADPERLPTDAAQAYRHLIQSGANPLSQLPDEQRWDLIIDGLFGIGLSRNIETPFTDAIDWINKSGSPVLALDIPSGLDSDNGNVLGICINATETISFIGLKPGLLTADGKDYCGQISVASLEIDTERFIAAQGHLLDQQAIVAHVPHRRANSHKGNFGSVGIVGGAKGMQGAAALAGRAALQMGAGRVYLGTQAPLATGYDPVQPELMWRDAEELLALPHLNALVVGPGMGQSETARLLLARCIESPLPLLLDADALNLIAAHEPLQAALATRRQATLITPHPTEAARLLDCDTAAIQRRRLDAALELAEQYRAAVVLKGAGSICALPDGRWFINPTGNPGLASGGTGDVLSGMIGALLAQGLNGEQALQLGVYLHGAAADSLVEKNIGPIGLTASEIIGEARGLLNTWIYTPHSMRDTPLLI